MTIVAVTGDACTTTAVVLATAWPSDVDVVLVEADPTGGDLAAWFDLPVVASLSTAVTHAVDGTWPKVERHIRRTDAGLRVLPASANGREAAGAVDQAGRAVVPAMALQPSTVVVADTGRLAPVPASNPFIAFASATVVVHRQATQSPAAAAVRLRRFADQLDLLAGLPTAVVGAVIGAHPFGLAEIESFVTDAVGWHPLVGLPVDDLTAAVVGGHIGVSYRRLARQPLMRAGRDLTTVIEQSLAAGVLGAVDGAM